MAAAHPSEDEPRYEQIGRDVFDDGGAAGGHDRLGPGYRGRPDGPNGPGGPSGPGRPASEEDDGGPAPVPFRISAAAAVRAAWADAAASFAKVSFWALLAAAVAAAGMTAYLLLGWFGVQGEEKPPPLVLYLLTGGALSLAAAILGSLWGFTRGGPAALTFPVRLLACLLRGSALAVLSVGLLLGARAVLGGPGSVEYSVDPGSGLPETPVDAIPAPPGLEFLAVLLVLFEVGVFALVGIGFRALFRARLPGAMLTVLVLCAFAVGNFAAAFMLLPGTLVTERTSIPVNVERDNSGRYLAYECIGQPVRSETVLHSEHVMWLTAGNPAVLYWALASGQVPTGGDAGWVLASLQRSTEGPVWDVACINGVPSDEVQPGFPLSVIGIAGQLGTAAAVTAAGALAGRRRART